MAAEFGFESVDLDEKSLIDEYGLDNAREILVKNDVVIGSIGLPVKWRKSNQEFSQDLTILASVAKAAADPGCTNRSCTYKRCS